MDLLEYQGKELFRRFGLPTPEGRVARTPAQAAAAAAKLGPTVAVKAQVRSGGRGKAGGVKVVHSPDEARDEAQNILGLTISGLPVRQLLVEAGVDIAHESYLSILLDRSTRTHLIIASAEGGVDIEAVAATMPEAIARTHVHPTTGLQSYQVNKVVRSLGVPNAARRQAADAVRRLYRLYVEAEATLVEVNPLVVTADGQVLALDSKVSLDDSARFRHPEFEEFEHSDLAEDSQEQAAAAQGLSTFVRLDGDVGIIGNGAGLVMSTLDLVDQVGGRAANFLDVGGGADAQVLSRALRLILTDGRVRSVVVNIFGGITRCDLVAQGVVEAMGSVEVKVPVVVRLAGTNADEGLRILEAAPHPMLVAATTMLEAAQKAVGVALD